LLVANDDTSAIAFSQQAGKVVTFVCASTGRPREIWGTDVYSIDSPICTAAVHAGVRAAGTSAQVSLRIGAAATDLRGAERNGVTSQSYPRADYTYSFVANGETAEIGWNTTFDRVPDDFTSPLTVRCPPNGNLDTVIIGTDVYRADSAICVAAVHVGLFTPEAGGLVTVSFQTKRSPLAASERNGVSSAPWSAPDYAAFPQPFSVTPAATTVAVRASAPAVESGPQEARRSVPAAASPPPPVPPAQRYNPGPRTISVAGYIARGTGPVIVPRLIATTGFTAAGTGRVIVPRTVRTSGWIGSGTNSN
jgi:hypothetical protein